MKTYSEKLKDPRWQRKRLEILSRDKFTCRHCGSKEKTLHVHHRIYRKGKSPWDYDDSIFRTLCEECHEVAEERKEAVMLAMGRSRRQDENLELLASAINGDPMEWTIWGWAAEHLAQCIRMQSIVERDPKGDNLWEVFEEARTASLDAIKEIIGALSALEKSHDE